MRRLPRQIPDMYGMPTVRPSSSVGWSIDSHVYPDHLIVRQAGGPETIRLYDGPGARIDTRTYEIYGVGLYTTYAAIDREGCVRSSTDSLIVGTPVRATIDEALAVWMLEGRGTPEDVCTIECYLDGLIRDTARAVMAGWADSVLAAGGTMTDQHILQLCVQSVWVPGLTVPVGFGPVHSDLRRDLPITLG